MNARSEWLAERRTGIGGSDAAAIVGISKWRTPYEVWAEKRGELVEQEDNMDMLIGRALEPEIRQRYADKTGRVVMLPQGILRHPVHSWMLASLDGLTEDGRVLEIKSARLGPDWGEPGTDEIPKTYLLQVQHYLAVTELPVADVAVMFKDRRTPAVEVYEVHADAELQAMLIEAEGAFWKCVVDGTPPPPVSYADAMARYGRASVEGQVIAEEPVEEAVSRLRYVQAKQKELEAEAEEARAIVMLALGDKDTLVSGTTGKPIVTWKAAKPSQRFDATAFRDTHPDLYQRFLVTGQSSRRFLLK